MQYSEFEQRGSNSSLPRPGGRRARETHSRRLSLAGWFWFISRAVKRQNVVHALMPEGWVSVDSRTDAGDLNRFLPMSQASARTDRPHAGSWKAVLTIKNKNALLRYIRKRYQLSNLISQQDFLRPQAAALRRTARHHSPLARRPNLTSSKPHRWARPAGWVQAPPHHGRP